MKNKQTIKCDVTNCKYLDCNKELCKLNSIKVSHNKHLTTLCYSFKEKEDL